MSVVALMLVPSVGRPKPFPKSMGMYKAMVQSELMNGSSRPVFKTSSYVWKPIQQLFKAETEAEAEAEVEEEEEKVEEEEI